MDMLRRFVGGDGNERERGNGVGKPQEPPPDRVAHPAKEGGHGDHWGCVFRSVEQDALVELIREVVESDTEREKFPAVGGGAAYRSAERPVRVCVLVADDTLQSAYPDAAGGLVWPIVVREIVPWRNGFEGQITGECYGAAVSFFDTHFYANKDRYRIDEQYNFHMSAFAYSVNRAPDEEVEIAPGTRVSLKGARAYMPANMGSNQGADIDEFWFHSPLEAAPTEIEFAGRRLWVLPVTMALPDRFDMSVPLYTAEHALDAPACELQPEDDLEGYLWLQGYLADE